MFLTTFKHAMHVHVNAVFKSNNAMLTLAWFDSSVCYIHLLNANRAGQSQYVRCYVSGAQIWHLAGCSTDKMWRARGQQPSHGGLPVVLVLRGLKNEMCVCSSEHFCCQVSAVPICSSHRASWTRSAINQTAATAEQGPVVSLLAAQFSKKSRPPVTLLKGCSCRVNRQRRNPKNNPDHVT